MPVVPIRECDCCGQRKPDVKADGCGAYQCEHCLQFTAADELDTDADLKACREAMPKIPDHEAAAREVCPYRDGAVHRSGEPCTGCALIATKLETTYDAGFREGGEQAVKDIKQDEPQKGPD